MPRARALSRSAVAAVALTVAASAPALAAPATFAAGSSGIGDTYYPTYGNGGYTVSNYQIDVRFRPKSGRLTGTTTITAQATEDLSRFDLDFVLKTTSVTVNGQPATFRQYKVSEPSDTDGGELEVTPAAGIPNGTAMTIVVEYDDVPKNVKVDGWSPWINTPTGALIQGEAESAAWWYPSNDHPSDKATFDITITTPSAMTGLSNGVLLGQSTHDELTTWRWRVNQPMATYLSFMAVGDYDLTTGTTAAGLPSIVGIERGSGATGERAAQDLARTPEIIDWLSQQWGPYPFDAVGGVVPNKAYGDCCALENQTRPTYPKDPWQDGGHDLPTVVHENAHQWFGDSVSIASWKDIWLNEGFATFSEWLWSEDHGGDTAQQHFADTYASYGAGAQFWKVRVSDPGVKKLFADPVYFRGAMALQALRNRVGDAMFHQIARAWVTQHQYGNADVQQFEALATQLSGQDLTAFFRAWLDDQQRPAPTAQNGFVPSAAHLVRSGS